LIIDVSFQLPSLHAGQTNLRLASLRKKRANKEASDMKEKHPIDQRSIEDPARVTAIRRTRFSENSESLREFGVFRIAGRAAAGVGFLSPH
jgi:hypothetical protein